MTRTADFTWSVLMRAGAWTALAAVLGGSALLLAVAAGLFCAATALAALAWLRTRTAAPAPRRYVTVRELEVAA